MNVARSSLTREAECPPPDPECKHLRGLRAVALLEGFKGLLGLAAGFALFSLVHKDLGDVAENVIEFLHLNPAHRLVQNFLHAADRVSDHKIVALACIGFAYAAIRFVEAYGLWHARAWAEWFAIISGSAYVPLEIIEVVKHHTGIRWAVLVVNILVVMYMIFVRWDELRRGHSEQVTRDRLQPESASLAAARQQDER